MIKVAYYYQGNKEYIKDLLEFDLYFIIDDEKYINELLQYNKTIRKIQYDANCYDVAISNENNLDSVLAIRKVVIGNYKEHKNKTIYIDKFDIKKITEKSKKNDIKFSIIVPNFNNGDWINKTIESVINQSYQNWEMYIIDDMSTDNSIEVINKYKDKRIELIQNEIKLYNGGSRNVGILKAKKSNPNGYLLFIDSDDWLANNKVMENLNSFIEGEDLITMNYEYYKDNQITPAQRFTYHDKDELFMTIGCMCAVWCKCFKVSVAPLFEFNTLMEDRNYHYRLINRIQSFAHFNQITHTWNKMNTKSVTSSKDQKYNSELQAKIEWNNCAYRHIAGMLDLLNEINNPKWRNFIMTKVESCKNMISFGQYVQL